MIPPCSDTVGEKPERDDQHQDLRQRHRAECEQPPDRGADELPGAGRPYVQDGRGRRLLGDRHRKTSPEFVRGCAEQVQF
jgi:hypothetical protein